MKMTKKFLLGAVAALAAVMFTGCMPTTGIGGKIKVNENMDADDGCLATAKISYANDSTEWARGIRELRTKHEGMTVKMVIQNQTKTSNDGVIGLVWDKTTNDDKTLNFMVMGFRNNSGTIQYYISYYANINKDELGYYNFGASEAKDANAGLEKADLTPNNAEAVTKETFDPSITTPYEIIVVNWTALSTSLGEDTAIADMDSDECAAAVSIAAKIVAEENSKYTVTLYKGSDMKKYAIADGASAIATVEIPNTKTGVDTTAEDYVATNVIEEKVGFYVNIYPKQTLSARWFLGDLEGNPIAADWDDSEIELNPIFE